MWAAHSQRRSPHWTAAAVMSERDVDLSAACFLCPAKVDGDSVFRERQVCKVDRCEFRSSEGAGEAHKDKRAIAHTEKVIQDGQYKTGK